MDFDLKKISKAWYDSYFGPDSLKELAKKRTEICNSCPDRGVALEGITPFPKCNLCGCPISKKVFSNVYNDCPAKKWESIDSKSEYFKNYKKKTLI